MFIFTIMAILMVALLIAHSQEKKLADTLGITCLGFILILYILAFFQKLSLVDYLAVPLLIYGFFWMWRNRQFGAVFKELFTIQNICIIVVLMFLVISQFSRIAVWWDDINFWATDVKGLWVLDGFAGKYGNVAPEFGDYPPAIQLFKWFFLHMSSDRYIEGLGFAGYVCLNFILLLPLISRIDELVPVSFTEQEEDEAVGVRIAKNKKYYVDDRKLISKYKVKVADKKRGQLGENVDPLRNVILVVINIVACIILILLPTVVNIIGFEGTCIEITMGIIYGMLLLDIWDRDLEHSKYYAVRLAIYGGVLVLCKSVGAEWAFFAAAFMLMCFVYRKKGEKFDQASLFDTNIRYGIATLISWAVAFGSWMVFCLINRRVASLTSSGINMVKSGRLSLSYYAEEKVPLFLKGVLFYPMHTDKTWAIDLPVSVLILIFIVAIVIMEKKGYIDKNFKKRLIIFVALTAIVSLGIVLIGHLTIFAAETQYSTAQVMAISISRYIVPFTLGTMILLIGICIRSVEKYTGGRPVTDSIVKEQLKAGNLKEIRRLYIVIALLVLLTCDYSACIEGLVSYRHRLAEDRAAREEMIDTEAQKFVSLVKDNKELREKRVLYIRDAGNNRWVHNAYINNETVPVAVVYGAVSFESTVEDIGNIISGSHAKYMYVDDIEGVGEAFQAICDGEYKNGVLFRVKEDGSIEEYYATMDEEP